MTKHAGYFHDLLKNIWPHGWGVRIVEALPSIKLNTNNFRIEKTDEYSMEDYVKTHGFINFNEADGAGGLISIWIKEFDEELQEI